MSRAVAHRGSDVSQWDRFLSLDKSITA